MLIPAVVLIWHDLRIVHEIVSHSHKLQQAGNYRWCNWQA
jgi:hypothetical protein